MSLVNRLLVTPSLTFFAKYYYPLITRYFSGDNLVFINWGYQEDPPMALPLEASDEPERGQTWPAPIIPTARLRRSANTPEAGEIFHKISGGRNAFGGFGHPGGDLAGPGDVLRGEDGAQVCDQRFLG